MRRLASKPVLAVVLLAGLAAALSACGRKGPLVPPAESSAAPAPTQSG